MAAQPGLCLIWLETLKTGFLAIWLKYFQVATGISIYFQKGGLSYITDEAPDVLCVQETKCSQEDMPDDAKVDGYYVYFSSAEQAGYAGTGMYCKTKPLDVKYGLG